MINVNDLMTTNLYTLSENDTLRTARLAMAEHRIRHIPIVDADNRFLGILTQRDVLALTVSSLADMDAEEREALDTNITLREVMSRNALTVDAKTSLREAAGLMLERKIGCLPVVTGDYLIGILTEADFLKLVVHLVDRIEELGEEY
ncbi:MAG: CBS domain-containing protein [Proteobacteria bacterium]|nr:MAG: CBS domain-containing protein [Pseudomonadota bacterium]